MASTIIDSAPLMVSFLDSLGDLEPENADTTSPPSLYLDLEGNNLGRNGSLTMIQVLVYPRNHVYLIDVLALGEKAFSTKGSNGDTFKEILESGSIPKAFFDLRNDCDALYSHFNVSILCVLDIQLMALASSDDPGGHVRGLKRCVVDSGILNEQDTATWVQTKEEGSALYKADPSLWEQRPLPEALSKYSVEDVTVLPALWKLYKARLSNDTWDTAIEIESHKRAILSQMEFYNPEGPCKTQGPWMNKWFPGMTSYVDE